MAGVDITVEGREITLKEQHLRILGGIHNSCQPRKLLWDDKAGVVWFVPEELLQAYGTLEDTAAFQELVQMGILRKNKPFSEQDNMSPTYTVMSAKFWRSLD